MAADLMHADVTAARLLLCMSAGYFLADSYDLWRNNKLTWDLAVHHVVVSEHSFMAMLLSRARARSGVYHFSPSLRKLVVYGSIN